MTSEAARLEKAPQHDPLPSDRLYRRCEPAELPFDTTEELEPLAEHLGQDRAVEALEFGLQIPHDGYNIFLLGSTGVGKSELLDSVLSGLLKNPAAIPRPAPSDWCYVCLLYTSDAADECCGV